MQEAITVAQIVDCPTITVHAGKCYKAIIGSEPLYHYSNTLLIRILRTVTRPHYSSLQPN